MNRKLVVPALAVGLTLRLAIPSWSLGLAMRFVDVTLENIDPGTNVNLRQSRNLPLVVINQDPDAPVDVVIEPMAPNEKEMKDGYEPLQDLTWLKIVPNRVHLGPKASAACDVIIDIPNDPKFLGHHYEGIVWVHTEQKNRALPQGGVMFQAGLRSRFRMSIGTKGPASLQREKALKKLATINSNFLVNPDNAYAQGVALGHPVDLKKEQNVSIKVINQADDPIQLKIGTAPADPNIMPQVGYEYAPDPKWLTVTPTQLEIPGNAIKPVKLTVNIPDKPENHNKKYMFLLQTTLADDSLPLLYNNAVYITTQP